MSHIPLTLLELGAVFFLLGVGGRLAGRFGLSPIPLYLIAGLVLGGMGFGETAMVREYGGLTSEIGIVLLLLMLGLEYTAAELADGLRGSWQAGLFDLVVNAMPGALLALLLGWGPVGILVMGGVTYSSSSGVVAKVLADLGRLGNRETPVVLAILVFEDLAMAVYLPILTTVLAGVGFALGLRSVAISLLAVAVILYAAFRHGKTISRLVASPDKETLMLKVLGVALFAAGLAAALDISAAVGAFLLGIAVSGDTAGSASEVLEPLRDLFAALFFVLFGITTPLAEFPPVLGWALVLVVVSTLAKIWTGWWAAGRLGIGRMGRIRAGVALIAHGEFSIVVAGLAVAVAAVPPETAALVAAYVLMLAVVGPVAARAVEPVSTLAVTYRARWLERDRSPA